MKNEIEKLYLIDRYLKGELLGLALDEFKSKLRHDKDFAKEVEIQKAIIEGIKLARREHLLSVLKGEIIPGTQLNSSKNSENISEPRNKIETKLDAENTYKKMAPSYSFNSNNWYFAAAAVLFAGFFLYLIFGYYLPHQKLQTVQQDTIETIASEPKINVDEKIDEEPELVSNPFTKDSSVKKEIDIVKVDQAKPNDSISVVKDKKISETMYSVSAFETIKSANETNPNVAASSENDLEIKKTPVRKVRGSTVQVEYWESIVNFKGYKLNGGNLKLFDVKADEKVKLKYLDKSLYLNKNGNYYKLNSTSNFESYQKETNADIIKLLEIN